MGHYTGQGLAVTLGGVALPGIREISIPEEHPAPDTTHAPDAHGTSIPGGITYHNGCTMLFVDQSGETSWKALPGGTVGTLAIYPEGIADGKRKITMTIVVTNRDRVMAYDNAVVFTVTFNATRYRAGISGEMDLLYVATSAGGVFVTDNFTAADDPDQPVWTAINDGLGVLTIRNLDLDPFDQLGRQVCLTKTEQTCYIRYGAGNWQPLITQAQFRALTNAAAVVRWVTFDRSVSGRIWVYGAWLNNMSGSTYMLYSDNDGASWSVLTSSTGLYRQAVQLYVSGDTLWRSYSTGAGGISRVAYSSNFGASWTASGSLGDSVWDNYLWLNHLNGLCYTAGHGIGGPDLVSVDTLGNISVLQDALDLGDLGGAWAKNDSQTMWHSADDAGYQRILRRNRLYTTLDAWTTVVDPAPAELVAGWAFNSLVAPFATDEDQMILGPRALAGGQEHIIYAMDGDTGTPVGKAGDDPAGGVDSIPASAGGLALNGIGAVVF